MTTLAKAIKAINSNASFTFNDDDLDTIQWNEGTTPISKSDILAKQQELQTSYDNLDYARKREKEYPSIADQLDEIYHNGIDSWKAKIKITKDKYPKESS